MHAGRAQRGAALLLLLAVAGLGAATLLLGAFGRNNSDYVRQQRTLAALAQAREALLGFAAVNGRLPRPAMLAADGNERPAECATDDDCSGFLPWMTLGVEGTDGWERRVRYSVTPVMTRAPLFSLSAVANRTVLQRDAKGILSYVKGRALCDVRQQCLPVIVFSQGKDGPGTMATGVRQANQRRGNADEVANDGASTNYISRSITGDEKAAGGPYDDMVDWITLPVLYQRMRAARNLP